MADTALLASAGLVSASTVVSTLVSLRHPHLVDEPFGLRFPGRVPVHLTLGLGSGVAIPWPLPVVATVAALCDAPDRAWPRRTCAAIGATILVGTVAEPASWGLRQPRSRDAVATVPLLLLTGAALFIAGTRPRPQGQRTE